MRARRRRAGPRASAQCPEVEAVEQRAGELRAVRGQPLRRARADRARVSARTARAEVHRRDELEARGKHRAPRRAGNADDAVLEWLPKRLERRPRELGKLVEEQDAVVGEARLARADPRA